MPREVVLPRRVSVDPKDEDGYSAHLWCQSTGRHCSASVNGVRIDMVITADVDKGFVERYRRGPDGKLLAEDGSLVLERIRGTVVLDFAAPVAKNVRKG